MTEILAAAKRASNADLIAECHQLGYLGDDDLTLDPTWGHGTFWASWRPKLLEASDIDPDKSPSGDSIDFTRLPWSDDTFDAVVLDPPYKLNGTPTHTVDDRYGVAGAYTSRAARHQLILDGVTEATRVLRPGGRLLVKVQDQVNAGQVRWQTDLVTRHAEQLGHRKVDALLLLGGRPQPAGRRQVHARRNYSTLLVFTLEATTPR
ncbi:MAG: hypothetical protein U5R31_03125 [Acidimicrobiia bacterium]|nr:hypothetical protein [Acidimicrobiia bacterium]